MALRQTWLPLMVLYLLACDERPRRASSRLTHGVNWVALGEPDPSMWLPIGATIEPAKANLSSGEDASTPPVVSLLLTEPGTAIEVALGDLEASQVALPSAQDWPALGWRPETGASASEVARRAMRQLPELPVDGRTSCSQFNMNSREAPQGTCTDGWLEGSTTGEVARVVDVRWLGERHSEVDFHFFDASGDYLSSWRWERTPYLPMGSWHLFYGFRPATLLVATVGVPAVPLQAYDAQRRKELRFPCISGALDAAKVSVSDGETIGVVADGKAHLVSVETGACEILASVAGTAGHVVDMALQPSHGELLILDSRGWLTLWDIHGRAARVGWMLPNLSSSHGGSRLSWSEDGNWAMVASKQRVWVLSHGAQAVIGVVPVVYKGRHEVVYHSLDGATLGAEAALLRARIGAPAKGLGDLLDGRDAKSLLEVRTIARGSSVPLGELFALGAGPEAARLEAGLIRRK